MPEILLMIGGLEAACSVASDKLRFSASALPKAASVTVAED
jgi:hypothetical protein